MLLAAILEEPLMIALRRLPFPLAAALVVALALLLALPLMGAKGGNSATAKACLKGGWESLSAGATPWIGFTSEDECVAAGAKGAALVPTSESAAQCLDGGWAELATILNVPFTDEGACIAYGVGGGSIVSHVAVTFNAVFTGDDRSACTLYASVDSRDVFLTVRFRWAVDTAPDSVDYSGIGAFVPGVPTAVGTFPATGTSEIRIYKVEVSGGAQFDPSGFVMCTDP
ncbi:hypothetical protein [Microbacterium hominis]|uniref:Uncharacterized protein n=1 Tax=Microbacterium hominis TaxID=162426 RepID=A0A7D4TR83_9MICO|nr:hypothetical protein [Microbacterium hominis]QKJ19724.1 hypothetical protein HQM25_10340 [Microbacterium hominis]